MDWVQICIQALFVGLNGYLVLRMTSHLDKMDAKIELSHERHNVTDRVVSTWTDAPYDSEQVANGNQPYPVMRGRA